MRKFRILALFLLLALFCPLLGGCAKTDVAHLRLTVLDVGQSDCMLLSLGERHMLIDTGTSGERAAVLGELAARGVDKLDFIVVTHPHEDHYGNARILLETRPVGALIVSNAVSPDVGYSMVLEAAEREKTEIRVLSDGESFSFGEAVCEVFCAMPDDPEGNNASLILRVRFGDCTLLFMGDAEAAAEEVLLSRETGWDCDFLKVGHHGSRTACSKDFLQATTPAIAVISCGENNDYGFPHREVLTGLEEVGAEVFRTDERGFLNFVCDGRTVTFEE